MFGHGISLAVDSRCRGKRPSLGCINQENFPMILSASFIFSWRERANCFLVAIAACCIIIQAFGAAKHITLFNTMETEYFETLKGQEAEKAAQLQVQMERMSYLESFPRRPDLVKGSSLLAFCVLLVLFVRLVVKEVAQESIGLPTFLLGSTESKLLGITESKLRYPRSSYLPSFFFRSSDSQLPQQSSSLRTTMIVRSFESKLDD